MQEPTHDNNWSKLKEMGMVAKIILKLFIFKTDKSRLMMVIQETHINSEWIILESVNLIRN